LNRKISKKDKKDWQNFISRKDKLPNKDLDLESKVNKKLIKTVDLHGFSLIDANNFIEKFIKECFENNVHKIIVITGKGLRSQNDKNPYISKDLSILKNSVPKFIKSKSSLIQLIKEIKEANIEDGGEGAFYILLRKRS
tara:strand:+ start:1290 stop:1706 length:417 start_codon:yes stop_codon:yes gene_type:complete